MAVLLSLTYILETDLPAHTHPNLTHSSYAHHLLCGSKKVGCGGTDMCCTVAVERPVAPGRQKRNLLHCGSKRDCLRGAAKTLLHYVL